MAGNGAFRFVDADGHVLEHPTRYVDLAPEGFKERIWHIETKDDGSEWLHYNGDVGTANGMAAAGVAGMSAERREAAFRGELLYTKVAPAAFEPGPRLEDMATDGIDQAVGDTIGPGGVIKGLRTVPVLLEVCRDMEELCPQAWLLNYTNPMAIACWAISDATSTRTVGLCHSVQNTAHRLAEYIGAPPEDISHWTAGINHMAWFLRFERDGQDAYPELLASMDDQRNYARDSVRFEVMRQFGYFVSESSRHMSEYTPYFRGASARMEDFNLAPFDVDAREREQRGEAHYAAIQRELESDAPLRPVRTNEYAAYIIDSMETGTTRVVNVNVRNEGLITNLPEGCCVEVPCVVDRLGVHPCHVGELPAQCAALIQTNVNVQRLAVKAILEADREAAIHAVMLDPLTSSILSLADIRAMVEEMFAAQPDYF
ncbi:MAG: alpha-glucosidase/alpha-galactosidase [Chloroflexi bacterium]|nr:alpha-glucosidase/alpha-galactosidase [Chloroflexota bacterium]